MNPRLDVGMEQRQLQGLVDLVPVLGKAVICAPDPTEVGCLKFSHTLL